MVSRRHIPPDQGKREETRERLLETAARLFAARGFRNVTVRDISRAAKANLAAVNYHFRDKLGLYREVVRTAIAAMRNTTESAMTAGGTGSAEDKLRVYVRVYLRHLVGDGRESWMHRLMAREMADPTPALDLVIEQGIRPRIAYLSGLIAEMLGTTESDERVLLCVASVQGQCLIYAPNPVSAKVIPGWRPAPSELDRIANHISEVSLAGIQAIAGRAPKPRRARRAAAPSTPPRTARMGSEHTQPSNPPHTELT